MSCPECFKGAIHDHAEPKGSMQTLYGYLSYVASPSTTTTSKSAILFITDAFGLNLVNNKLLADRYAAETGCKVVVPDIIPGGGGAPVEGLALMDSVMGTVAWTDIFGQLSRVWSGLRLMSIFIPFLIRANVDKAYPSILEIARAMRKDLPAGGKLGVAGFCWGAYGSTRLCMDTTEEGGSTKLIDAQFNAHPSKLKTPDMILDAVKNKIPYSVAIGDKDMVMSVTAVHETQAALKQKVGDLESNDYEIVIFPGVHHGFAVRAAPGSKVEMEASEAAANQAVAWFNRYLN